ncbi:MAG: hypothetical protein IJD01_00160 [Clostridia bacterium]|nr:hypothetical protein [Clostridia bacterium]
MLAPKGFRQVIDSRAYIRAQTAVSRRIGVLRWTLPMTVLAAAMVCGGAVMVLRHMGQLMYTLSAITLWINALIVLCLWYKILPDAVKTKAEKAYRTYDRLQNPVDITFSADELELKSAVMTRRTAIAKTRLCIETPARFVILADEGYTVILEKACFEERDTTEAFLRDVFARWIVKENAR